MINKICIIILLGMLAFSCNSEKGEIPTSKLSDNEIISKLMGTWETIEGDDEYISFEKSEGDYIFRSYLHQRPSRLGTWKVNDNKLTLTVMSGEMTMIYSKIIFNDDKLILHGRDDKEIYKKYSEKE